MKQYFKSTFFLICITCSFSMFSTTYTTINNGAWDAVGTWSGGVIPPKTLDGHTVNINHNISAGGNLIGSSGSNSNLVIGSGKTLTATSYTVSGGTNHVVSGGGTMSLAGALTLAGYNNSFNSEAATIVVGTNLVGDGGGATFIFGPLSVTGSISYNNGASFQLKGATTAGSMSIGVGGGGVTVTADAGLSIVGALNISNNGTIKGSGILNYGSISLVGGSKIIGGNGNAACTFTTVASLPHPPLNLASCALPITLYEFKVNKDGGFYMFEWSTLQELDNDYFTIEYSLDTKEYASIQEIEGAGKSNRKLDYQYVAKNLSFGRDVKVVYFRLKQTDYDGTFAYSHVVPLVLSSDLVISAYSFFPNPANTHLTLSLEDWTAFEGIQEISLRNVFGQVFVQEIEVKSKETKLSLENYPKGLYLISMDGYLSSEKIVKE